MTNLFKKIPQVSKLMEDEDIKNSSKNFYHNEIKKIIEETLADIREKISNKEIDDLDYKIVRKLIIENINSKSIYSLRKVINGTGTVVHTNLGRSLLAKSAIKNIVDTCSSYNNLEYNIEDGMRGSRYVHLENMVANILGCEAALVVNNNAAATMLAVGAFAKNKEVIVSRGELVEIGGSFRIPEIIEASNAILKEVGTTNRTHIKDYENAINSNTAMLLKVHPSNYAIQGFTKEVTNKEIAEIAFEANKIEENNIITLEDLGSGALIDFCKYSNIVENTVSKSLKSGMDLVTFSGDKLLGGPQSGIIVGKKKLIEAIKKHPLTRAFRVCKMTIAALEATIKLYNDEKEAIKEIPTLNMLFKDINIIRENAENLRELIEKQGYLASVIEMNSTVGGGSLPLSKLPSFGVTFEINGYSTVEIERKMRSNNIPIIGRIINDIYCIDVRTLLEGDISIIEEAIKHF